jgi:hypothetical protein
MKTSYLLLTFLGGLITLTTSLAEVPGPKSKAVVLLLHDFKILEGDYELDARGNYIRRVKNATEVVPGDKVLFVGDSRDAVNKFMLARSNEPTPIAPVKQIVDCHPQAAKQFTTVIQPILQNRCMECHAKTDYPGTFKLQTIPLQHADVEATRKNLGLAFIHLDRANPSGSDLLRYATTKHGRQKTAALTPNHPAYYTLELWAHAAMTPAEKPVPQAVPMAIKVVPPVWESKPKEVAKAPAKPALPPNDPFDPATFNNAKKP